MERTQACRQPCEVPVRLGLPVDLLANVMGVCEFLRGSIPSVILKELGDLDLVAESADARPNVPRALV